MIIVILNNILIITIAIITLFDCLVLPLSRLIQCLMFDWFHVSDWPFFLLIMSHYNNYTKRLDQSI